MTDRLTIITTRTGDDGTTGLADGTRVNKTSPRVVAMGEVDELNSVLGVVLAHLQPMASNTRIAVVIQALKPVQHALFDIGSELAIPGHTQLAESQLAHLDGHIERLNAELPSLKEFILPGGTLAATQTHVARTVCRRAERSVIAVANDNGLGDLAQQYLNRLSDLLFVLARTINQIDGTPEVFWRKT
jgi:cob(I)alamin adenosyltransferase